MNVVRLLSLHKNNNMEKLLNGCNSNTTKPDRTSFIKCNITFSYIAFSNHGGKVI